MRPSTLPLHDAAHGGQVVPLIERMTADGATYEAIVRAVQDLGVSASASTIYRWAKALSAPSSEPVAS
jgi:hypothetical protein